MRSWRRSTNADSRLSERSERTFGLAGGSEVAGYLNTTSPTVDSESAAPEDRAATEAMTSPAGIAG